MRMLLNITSPLELRDHSEPPDDPPHSYLFGQTEIHGRPFHIEAIQVRPDEAGGLQAVAESHRARLAALSTAFGGTFTTVELDRRAYVLLVSPHLRGETP
jgi:hypothetical protein